MDTLSSHACRSIQSYWRHRRAYERLDGASTSTGKNRRTVRLGGSGRARSCRSRIRVFRLIGRVKLIPSPKKLLGRLRDAYVNAMLSWSGNVPPTSKTKTTKSAKSKDGEKIGEFEMRMIMNIYNTVTANPREVRMINCRAETTSSF